MRKTRAFIGLFLLVFGFASVSALTNIQNVQAAIAPANSFEFIDGATIKVDINGDTVPPIVIKIQMSESFIDKNPWDSDSEFRTQGSVCSNSFIKLANRTDDFGRLTLEVPDPNKNNKCTTVYKNELILNIKSPTKNQLYFNWTGPDSVATINAKEGGSIQLSRSAPGSKSFVGSTKDDLLNNIGRNNPKCEFTVILIGTSTSNANVQLKCTSSTIGRPGGIASYSNVSLAGSPTNPAAADNREPSGSGSKKPSCENGDGAMRWIMCPVIIGLDGALSWTDSRIQELLEVDKGYYDNQGIRDATKNIRNIAYAILVPIMLVMIISTAMGFEFVSAYTMKKAMPRLAIAVIFIALSYPICVFLLELSNAVGFGTLGLITQPFSAGGNDVTLSTLFNGGFFNSLVLSGGIVLGFLVALLFFMPTILLFMLLAFLMLLVRQIILVALILAAPLAILAWIFPGNDKLWKAWWSSFSKLLLLFPLIMVLIAVGRIFATISSGKSSVGVVDGSVIQPLITLFAYTLPYALIPLTFKFAGGVFSQISGMLDSKTQGLGGHFKKKRAEKLARFQNQSAFKSKTGIRGRLNTLAAIGSNANKVGFNPGRWKARMGQTLGDNSMHQRAAMLEDKDYTFKGDDDLNRIAAESNNDNELRANLIKHGGARYQPGTPDSEKNLNEDMARINRMKQKYGDSAFRQTAWLQAIAGGTAFNRESDDIATPWTLAGKLAGGNETVLRDMVAKGKAAAMGAGDVARGGAGFGDTLATAQGRDSNGNVITDVARHQARSVKKAQGAGVLTHGSMKPKSITLLIPEINAQLDEALESGDQVAIDYAMADIANIQDSLAGGPPQIAEQFAKEVLGRGLVMTGRSEGVQQMFAGATQTVERRVITPRKEEQILDTATGNFTLKVTEEVTEDVVVATRAGLTAREAVEARRNSGSLQEKRRELNAQQQQQRVLAGAGGAPTPVAGAGGNPLALP